MSYKTQNSLAVDESSDQCTISTKSRAFKRFILAGVDCEMAMNELALQLGMKSTSLGKKIKVAFGKSYSEMLKLQRAWKQRK